MEDSIGGVNLNIGCGAIKWPGWIGVDRLKGVDLITDIRKLPLEDNHADNIAAIHVVEHFYYWEVPAMLQEWRRVLKPGGKLILELPCMDKVFNYIRNCMNDGLPMSPTFTILPLWGDPKFKHEGMCHKWGYTRKMLVDILEEVGFSNIQTDKPRYHFPQRDMRITGIK